MLVSSRSASFTVKLAPRFSSLLVTVALSGSACTEDVSSVGSPWYGAGAGSTGVDSQDTGGAVPGSGGAGGAGSGGASQAPTGGTVEAMGGMSTSDDGTLPATGGAAPTTGGVGGATGGVAPITGGVEQSSGGTPPATGGIAEVAGGSEQATGGSTAGTGGAPPSTGGAGPTTGGQAGEGIVPEPVECQGSFPAVSSEGAAYSIGVENGNSWGDLPHFWSTYGTGHLGLFLREDRGWGETLKAHVVDGVQNLGLTSLRQHGILHDDIGIYREEDGTPVYDFSRFDQVFDFFVEQGLEPIVELGNMPRDLARDPSATVFMYESGTSPPKDFALWQELVRRLVEHSVERYSAEVVNRWYFEVWNEPECCRGKFWTGTLDEYFELYDHTAKAVRSVLPSGRVGGPVASQPGELTGNSQLGVHFLDHVTTDNYLNPGSPGVLDFFAYHSWSFIDGAVNGYFQGIDLLDSYGLSNVPVAITEFGPTYEFNLYDEPQETVQGAAFVAQTYADISRRCAQEGRRFPIAYSWWVLSDIFQEETFREDEPFIGCMGLISRENIRKPAYNVYKFLAQMGDEQLPLSVSGASGVGGMAARDPNGGVQILVYNAQSPGAGPFDGSYYQVAGEQSIAVTVSGLDPEKPYDVTAYRVDETRGNAYATWEQMGRPKMDAMSEADWASLRGAMDSPAEPLGEALCGGTFTHTIGLSSPGVLFIQLTPST